MRDSGRNCLYFYPDAYLDEAQKRGIADKTEELRKGKRFMTFFCLVIFVVLIANIAGWNGVKDFKTASFETYLFLVVVNWFDGFVIDLLWVGHSKIWRIEGMGLYTNVRPAKMFSELSAACPLRADIAEGGIDFVVVRELIGGVYFGEHRTEEANGEQKATDIMAYSEHEIRRVARVAFETARKRRKRVTSIDKANVLDTSRLWRKTVTEVAKDYPDVELRHMYVDNAAMQLVRDPSQFDVIVTENLFGDILSDEASQITGSIGMIPSSSMGDGTNGLYEPIHGSAPDIAGQDKANPIGTILAAAMMLRYSFDMAADRTEQHAVRVAAGR